MWHVCEQPWTLLVVSVALYLTLQTLFAASKRSMRWWHTGLCVLLAVTAISLDVFVPTNREKIRHTIKTAVQAIEDEDMLYFQAVIDRQYQDSYHKTYEQVVRRMQKGLEHSRVERNKIMNLFIDKIQSDNAAALLVLVMHFDPKSLVAQSYKTLVIVNTRLTLHKQANGQWAIRRAELVEVDKQPITWSHIPGQF